MFDTCVVNFRCCMFPSLSPTSFLLSFPEYKFNLTYNRKLYTKIFCEIAPPFPVHIYQTTRRHVPLSPQSQALLVDVASVLRVS